MLLRNAALAVAFLVGWSLSAVAQQAPKDGNTKPVEATPKPKKKLPKNDPSKKKAPDGNEPEQPPKEGERRDPEGAVRPPKDAETTPVVDGTKGQEEEADGTGSGAGGGATGGAGGGAAGGAGGGAGGKTGGEDNEDDTKKACNYEILPKTESGSAFEFAAGRLLGHGVKADANALRSTTTQDGRLILVFAPDGKLLGRPKAIREDHEIYAVVYRDSQASGYDFEVSGCTALATRIMGEKKPDVQHDEAVAVVKADIADVHFVGKCNADSPVTIKITVPDQERCSARSETTTISTSPVYQFALAAAATIYIGREYRIGLTDDAGGMQRRITEESVWSPPAVRLFLGWYFGGYAPADRFSWRNLLIGTVVDADDPLDSASVALGLALSEGVILFGGLEVCRNLERLGGEVRAGDVFEDAEDQIPKEKDWTCGHTRGFFGIAATTELVTRFFRK